MSKDNGNEKNDIQYSCKIGPINNKNRHKKLT